MYDEAAVNKMLYNSNVCYPDIIGESGGGDTGQTPCYAVTSAISQYSDTTFDDVYDTTQDKWYKKNNLSQYEEYGVYGSGKNITVYDGKLTIDSDHEWQWSGSQWVDLGAVSGSSITIKSPEYISKTSSYKGKIDLGVTLTDDTVFQMRFKPTNGGGSLIFGDVNAISDSDDYRVFWYSSTLYYDYGSQRKSARKSLNTIYEFEIGNYYIKDLTTGNNVLSGATQSGVATSRVRPIWLFYGDTDYTDVYYLKVFQGGLLVKDFIPWTDMNGNYGLYDKVSNTVFSSTGSLTGSSTINDVEVGGGVTYPEYYDEIQEPPVRVTFSSTTEMYEYVCPYVGLEAIVGNDHYIFNSEYEWELKTSRLPAGYTEVEYIENTGTSYLNIDFKPNQDTRILTEMQAVTSSNYPRLFGAGLWNSSIGINLVYQPDGGVNCLHIKWYGQTSWSYNTSFTFDYSKHLYDLNKNSLYMDESLVGSTSYTSTYQSTDNLGVFTYMNGNRPSQNGYWGQEHFKGKMYTFKVYDNGTLVRDLVPAKRDSDNEVGAYDIVNDVFYTVPTGYTTDKLVAGNPV